MATLVFAAPALLPSLFSWVSTYSRAVRID